MSKSDLAFVAEAVKKMTIGELYEFYLFVSQASDEQIKARAAQTVAAKYVLNCVREDIHQEVAALHKWIRVARLSNFTKATHEHRRAAIRTDSERTSEFVSGTRQSKPAATS